MLKRIHIESERDHWTLTAAAAVALVRLRSLLAHPSLDLGLAEREEYERDAQTLAEQLPARLRLAADEETEEARHEAGVPF